MRLFEMFLIAVRVLFHIYKTYGFKEKNFYDLIIAYFYD